MLKLDIGGGLQQRGEDYVIVDKYIVGQRLIFKDEQWQKVLAPEYKYVQADMASLPFTDNSVDTIWSAHTLEHAAVGEVHGILKEWLRVLKPGKRAIIQVPNFDYIARYWLTGPDRTWAEAMVFGGQFQEGDTHRCAFVNQTLRSDLEAAGFEVVRIEMRWTHNQETLQAIVRKKERCSLISENGNRISNRN